jgi:HEAT repeat protein
MEAVMTVPEKQRARHPRTRWFVIVALTVLVTLTALALWSPVACTGLREIPGRMKTKVLEAASREVRRQVRGRMEARAFRTDLGIDQMIARLFDRTRDPITRYRDAYRLAKAGTPEAVAALQRFFQTATVPEKAAIAQLLGSWGNPRCKPWLWMLLDDSNEAVRIGAMRGLSVIGGEDVTAKLAEFLASPSVSVAMKIEAALGLGTIRSDSAYNALATCFERHENPDVIEAVVANLGRFPFTPQLEAAFVDYLARPDTPAQLRVAAVESLADSTPAAVPFLLRTAETDSDWEVRAGAAWALSAHGPVPGEGLHLLDLARQETDEIVRRRLYEALLAQRDVAVDRLVPLVAQEHDVAARVAGWNAVGAAVSRQSSWAGDFDRMAVPELLRIAMEENSLNVRLRAVFALRRAETTGARTALAQISQVPEPRVASAASHAGYPATSR